MVGLALCPGYCSCLLRTRLKTSLVVYHDSERTDPFPPLFKGYNSHTYWFNPNWILCLYTLFFIVQWLYIWHNISSNQLNYRLWKFFQLGFTRHSSHSGVRQKANKYTDGLKCHQENKAEQGEAFVGGNRTVGQGRFLNLWLFFNKNIKEIK